MICGPGVALYADGTKEGVSLIREEEGALWFGAWEGRGLPVLLGWVGVALLWHNGGSCFGGALLLLL